MDKLKKVLKRMKADREDGVHRHPWLDPQEAEKIDEKLRDLLKLNMKDEPAEGQEEAEEAGSDEEAPKKSVDDQIKDAVKQMIAGDDAEEGKFMDALSGFLEEKRA